MVDDSTVLSTRFLQTATLAVPKARSLLCPIAASQAHPIISNPSRVPKPPFYTNVSTVLSIAVSSTSANLLLTSVECAEYFACVYQASTSNSTTWATQSVTISPGTAFATRRNVLCTRTEVLMSNVVKLFLLSCYIAFRCHVDVCGQRHQACCNTFLAVSERYGVFTL